MSKDAPVLDYSLVGETSRQAIEKGLAEATWYTCPVSRKDMQKLLERKDGPAMRDTLLWFALIIGSGLWAYSWWGSWWAIIPFAIYGVLYASSSDSRWHESSHGTAFKSDWMNNVLYEIASFMVMRESTVWRWSHTRHHTDTIIVGRDPEIAVPRPPDIAGIMMAFFNLKVYPKYFKHLFMHCAGKIDPEEATFIPQDEYPSVFLRARIHLAVYAGVIALSIYTQSILPLLFVGLTNLYGSWLMVVYGLTQHAGLAENVLDHRLNCRTFYTNIVNRYLYWNMNYHVEHHMFPLVPYHALPKLHELVKGDMPKPYPSLWSCWKEIIPALIKQTKDPYYYVKRVLPERVKGSEDMDGSRKFTNAAPADGEGWIKVCTADDLALEDVVRFDYENRTYAIYQNDKGSFYATDGICTHGNTHLATGLVKGDLIECPKHNGRFDIKDGSIARKPVCVGLGTYPVKLEGGELFINPQRGKGSAEAHKLYFFTVESNDNVATFIKELVLVPDEEFKNLGTQPGDYLQLTIPKYDRVTFNDFAVQEPYQSVWKKIGVMDNFAENDKPTRRNYSIASNPHVENKLRFNVRIATPPRGQDCISGIGSSYVFNLKPGDRVSAIGPFGEFHVKETENEMVYLGGGAGMAPLRAHISYLFETLQTGRKVSFWYGARSLQEVFYREYFEGLAAKFENFSFHLALSEPLPEDNWSGPTGFIHEVARDHYLKNHPDIAKPEFYLCGPPPMIAACKAMFKDLGVQDDQVAYDEFN